MNTRLSILAVAAVAMVAAAPGAAIAAEAYKSYDTFTATKISPLRWDQSERHRQVANGVLSVTQREYGMQTSDSGTYNESWSTTVDNPSAITQMKSTISVKGFRADACAANADPTSVQARMGGAFFNVGPGLPTSRIGDVVALAFVYRASNSTDAANVLRVDGVVAQCTTTDCNYGAIELGRVSLGTTVTGGTATLKLFWDPANNRFDFQRGSEAVQSVTYAVADDQLAFAPSRFLGTRMNLANCFSGPRTEGFVNATFDLFQVNASAAP